MIWYGKQLWDAFGIFLGYSANLIVLRSPIAWRLQAGSSFLPAVPLLLLIYFCPESPRWYIKQHKLRDAYDSAVALTGNKLLAARDIYLLWKQIEVEDHYLARYKKRATTSEKGEPAGETEQLVPRSTYFRRAHQLFSLGRIRRATVASFIVMLSQQLCGELPFLNPLRRTLLRYSIVEFLALKLTIYEPI